MIFSTCLSDLSTNELTSQPSAVSQAFSFIIPNPDVVISEGNQVTAIDQINPSTLALDKLITSGIVRATMRFNNSKRDRGIFTPVALSNVIFLITFTNSHSYWYFTR